MKQFNFTISTQSKPDQVLTLSKIIDALKQNHTQFRLAKISFPEEFTNLILKATNIIAFAKDLRKQEQRERGEESNDKIDKQTQLQLEEYNSEQMESIVSLQSLEGRDCYFLDNQGKSFALKIHSLMTKEAISMVSDILFGGKNPRIVINGKVLNDNDLICCHLTQYKIIINCVYQAEREKESVEIVLKEPQGQERRLVIPDVRWSIGRLYEIVAEEMNMLIGDFFITFAGQLVLHPKTMLDYGIYDQAVIYVVNINRWRKIHIPFATSSKNIEQLENDVDHLQVPQAEDQGPSTPTYLKSNSDEEFEDLYCYKRTQSFTQLIAANEMEFQQPKNLLMQSCGNLQRKGDNPNLQKMAFEGADSDISDRQQECEAETNVK